jgi:aspartyl/asparaginyl beta-hydroxylase (cupin superfamily)
VDLSPELHFCKKILNYLNVENSDLFVFYYLDPRAKIHPHRDLTGASLNNRIRFHVPVITNDDVKFIVDGNVVNMLPGSLRCLDTSYVHQVENGGKISRVHIVIECKISNDIKNKLPKGWRVREALQKSS